jgi:hypothetical protein
VTIAPLFRLSLLVSFALGLTTGVLAAIGPNKTAARPQLVLVVVIPLTPSANPATSAFTSSDFDRLDLAFQDMAQRRHWPVTIVAERFAANTPARDMELRIFLQPVRQDFPEEYRFRGWMSLSLHGNKHDLGMIIHSEFLRAGESIDDFLDKVFRGAATIAARRIEPILFPNLLQKTP